MNREPLALILVALALAWTRLDPDASSPAVVQAATKPASAATEELDTGRELLERHLGHPLPAGPFLQPNLELFVQIATLPDPRASHLDWAYDSHLDAIRRAFERVGFVLDRFFLPWEEEPESPDDVASLPGRPGVLLFRQLANPKAPSKLWLVYLVGELSTGGIDREAFHEALVERAELLRGDLREGSGTLGILPVVGPVFSGSSLSLSRALEDDALGATTSVEVVSGSATSPTNASVLTSEAAPAVRFRSTLHTDATLLAVFEGRVLPALGLAKDEVAILQESTTEYGHAVDRSSTTGTREFLRIPFPMSIGSLRATYFEEAGGQPSEERMPGRSPRSIVGLDLEGSKTSEETIDGLSDLSPPSIDLLLEETTRMLAQHGIRGALVFATDVRDKLFLGTELRKRLPDLQLFTTESNILYVWSDLNRSLRGMIVLSSYPLMLRDAGWRPQSSDYKQLIFANEGAEGTFNATLLQLDAPWALADYGHPVSELPLERPPVWVTVVGASTLLPLAVFEPGSSAPAATPSTAATGVSGPGANAFHSGRGFVAVAGISLLSLILLAAVSVNWWGQRGSASLSDQLLSTVEKARPPSWPSSHARILRVSLALHHELYTVFYYASLACLLLPAVLLIVLRASSGFDALILPRVLGVLALLACAAALVVRARSAIGIVKTYGGDGVAHVLGEWPSSPLRREWSVEVLLRSVVVVLAVIYAIVSLCFCGTLVGLALDPDDSARFELFFHRSIEVDQGVSVLVPLALLGAILAAWCHWHLFRIRSLAAPQLAELALAPEDASSGVRQRLFNVVPASSAGWVLLGIVLGSLWIYFQFARTLDDVVLDRGGWPSAFDLLLRAGIVGALGATAWATVRLLCVWTAFARELRVQDECFPGLPYAEIRKEAGFSSSVSLLPSAPAVELECVARTKWGGLPDGSTESAGVEPLRSLMAALRDPDQEQVEGRKARKEASERRKRIQSVVAAELALYREWVLRHMRRLSFFILLSIVLTTLLISSYPFQPQHLIRAISLFVFGASIAGLVWTIASMNRNPALSRMSGTSPGALTWDRSLYVNLGLYVIVPAITLLSSQAPALRKFLFQWVEPLAGFLVKT